MNGWLCSKDATSLLAAEISRKYNEMNPSAKLHDADYVGPDFRPGERQIHVLVELPQPKRGPFSDFPCIASKLTSFGMKLEQRTSHGDLPSDGDFLNLFDWTDEDGGTIKDITAIDAIVDFTGSQFYVRKEEILCVLKNFMKLYQDEFTRSLQTVVHAHGKSRHRQELHLGTHLLLYRHQAQASSCVETTGSRIPNVVDLFALRRQTLRMGRQ